MPAAYYTSTGGTGDTWREWSTTSTTTTTYSDTWPIWVTASDTTGTSTSCVTRIETPVERTWYAWTTEDVTTTTTSSTADTWVTWTTDSAGNVEVVQRSQQPSRHYTAPPPPTPEQIRAQEARKERYRLEREERERKRLEAEARATELLMDNLTQEQLVEIKRSGFFFVKSKKPERQYRIRKGRVGNVDVLENGKVLHRLCAHPDVLCPDDDTRLAQKLMLEHMEDAFIGRANVHPPRH